MLVLGVASSHAPSLFQSVENWDSIYEVLSKGIPQPKEAADETPEVIEGYIERIKRSFTTLRDRLRAARVDTLIIIGGDQSEQFDKSLKPAFAIYRNSEAWSRRAITIGGAAEEVIPFHCDVELSEVLLNKLVRRGFDVNIITELRPLVRPERGLPHAFSNPAEDLFPDIDISTVLVYENTYDPPSPTAELCYEFGQAIAQVCRDHPKRIAIYGSGGLSHDPRGPRSGWIDKPLDTWVLRQIEEGNGQALKALYKFDSMTMVGGTGEIRAWITVAGACEEVGMRAQVVDYIPAHKSVTGLGFAYWEPKGATS